MDELTIETKKILCLVYKEYIDRKKNGINRESAKLFNSNFYEDISQLSKYSKDDINSFTEELLKADYIEKYIDGSFELQNKAIIILENRFKNNAKEVLNFLTSLI